MGSNKNSKNDEMWQRVHACFGYPSLFSRWKHKSLFGHRNMAREKISRLVILLTNSIDCPKKDALIYRLTKCKASSHNAPNEASSTGYINPVENMTCIRTDFQKAEDLGTICSSHNKKYVDRGLHPDSCGRSPKCHSSSQEF